MRFALRLLGIDALKRPRPQTLAIVLCLLVSLLATGLASAAKPLSVTLRADVSSKHGGKDLLIRVKTVAGARCGLRVLAGRSRAAIPDLVTSRRGKGGWSWTVPSDAPSGTWTFKAQCRKGAKRGAGKEHALLLTRGPKNGRGQLVAPSTGQITDGHDARAPEGYGGGGNSYPWGECTWYVKERRPDIGNNWGNAGGWLDSARRAGFPTGQVATPGAVAVWGYNSYNASWAGHVAIVERVLPNNQIVVSDSNWVAPLRISTNRVMPIRGIIGYIYGGPAGNGPGSGPPPPPAPPFAAYLDAQFPIQPNGHIDATAGDSVPFGFNLHSTSPTTSTTSCCAQPRNGPLTTAASRPFPVTGRAHRAPRTTGPPSHPRGRPPRASIP